MRTLSLFAVGAAALALLPGLAAGGAIGGGAGRALQPLTCPVLEVSVKTSVNAHKGTEAGKSLVLTGRVKNTGNEALENVAVGFHLPANGELCRTKATLYPNPRTQEVQLRSDGGANFYWEGFTLGAGKWRKFELKMEVSAALAQGGELAVAAVGYLLDGDCTTVTEPAKIPVHPLPAHREAYTHNSAHAVCAADLPAPDTRRALAVAAENQRCGEAGEVVVSDERRPPARGVRRLPTVVTQETCWAQCSEDGYRMPFYMSVERAAQGGGYRCFCSHTCQPIYRQGVQVHQVNRHATVPFGEKAARRR